jgi:signal transduction histidine kinase
MARDKALDVVVDVRDAPTVIYSDRTLLKQVLLNLVGNAVKFTETGGVTLSVQRDGRACVALRVEDTGPGIAYDDLVTVFDQFTQVRIGQRKPDGTGLGLAIVVRLMELLEGDIEVSSARDEGTSFTVIVPLTWTGETLANEDRAAVADVVGDVEKG